MPFDFEAQYAEYPAEALLAIVKNRDSYQPEAVAAAEALLARRPPAELAALLVTERPAPTPAPQSHAALSDLLQEATAPKTGLARLKAGFQWESPQTGARTLLLLGTLSWCVMMLYLAISGLLGPYFFVGNLTTLAIAIYTGACFVLLAQGNRWGWRLSAPYGFWLVLDLAGRLFWQWARNESPLELFPNKDVILQAGINVGVCVLLLRKDIRAHYGIGNKALKHAGLVGLGLFLLTVVLRGGLG